MDLELYLNVLCSRMAVILQARNSRRWRGLKLLLFTLWSWLTVFFWSRVLEYVFCTWNYSICLRLFIFFLVFYFYYRGANILYFLFFIIIIIWVESFKLWLILVLITWIFLKILLRIISFHSQCMCIFLILRVKNKFWYFFC